MSVCRQAGTGFAFLLLLSDLAHHSMMLLLQTRECSFAPFLFDGLIFLWVTTVLVLLLQVSMGDEGLSQCAGKCDTAPGCVGYSMIESGLCSMMKAINVSVLGLLAAAAAARM